MDQVIENRLSTDVDVLKYKAIQNYVNLISHLEIGIKLNYQNILEIISLIDVYSELDNKRIYYKIFIRGRINFHQCKKIFVIRPSRTVGIKRIERDIDKIQEMYDLGKSDIQEKMDGLLNYLKE